jgi:hypothetical protein
MRQVRRRLAAGGRRIRTLSPSRRHRFSPRQGTAEKAARGSLEKRRLRTRDRRFVHKPSVPPVISRARFQGSPPRLWRPCRASAPARSPSRGWPPPAIPLPCRCQAALGTGEINDTQKLAWRRSRPPASLGRGAPTVTYRGADVAPAKAASVSRTAESKSKVKATASEHSCCIEFRSLRTSGDRENARETKAIRLEAHKARSIK